MSRVPLSRQIATLVAEQPHVETRCREAVRRGRMRPGEMGYILDGIEAAIATLTWLRDHEAVVRRVHAEIAASEGGDP